MRPPDEGRQDFKVLGRVRGGFGNPFPLNAEPGKELDVVLRDAASDALRHAGYATAGSGTRRLDVDVLKFWCDGYAGYKISSIVVAKLVDGRSGRVLAQKQIQVTEGFALVVGFGPMHEAFNRVVSKTRSEIMAFIDSREFQAAAR